MKKQTAAAAECNTAAPPPRRAQAKTVRRTAAMRLLAYQIIADGFRVGDLMDQRRDRTIITRDGGPDHLGTLVSEALGTNYATHEDNACELVDDIREALQNDDLRAALDKYVTLRNEECWAIGNAMLELGRLAGHLETEREAPRRATIDRFLDALQSAIEYNALDDGHRTEEGRQHDMEQFRRAIPVARAIALLSNPLNCTNGPTEKFINELQADTDEIGADGAMADGYYFSGLALGLILADQVGER